MLSDAELYSGHHKMQRHDTALFLESVVQKMDWSSQEQDVVMDIGCGPGKSSREMFLSTFPKVRKVIGVDVLEDMIEFAKKNNSHEKMEYHVANIEDRDSILKWSKQISKVISIYCFNWLTSQRKGFENIYHMLTPGGEAALLFVLSTPFWDSYQLHYDNPKWSKYLENKPSHIPESHFKRHGATFYRNLLQEIGFKVIICEDEKRVFAYPSDEDCRNSISVCPLTSHIPDELKPEFQEEVMRAFLQYNGRNSKGEPVLNYTVLSMLVKKPEDVL
nr:juvenile hormone acid methyltransferase-3 [Pardosa pseudoannulata]